MNTISDMHAAHRARPDARAVTDLVTALAAEYGKLHVHRGRIPHPDIPRF